MVYEEPLEDNLGAIHENLNDDIEVQVVENPYYECGVETNHQSNRISSPDRNGTEIITSRQNDYYEM